MDAIVCGIDPGLAVTGYAVLQVGQPEESTGRGFDVLDAGICNVSSNLSLPQRLAALHADVSAVLAEHRPAVVAVEQLYSHYQHPRTAIFMGHARGVILLAAAQSSLEVKNYSATRIKRFLTGNGRARKPQIQRAIQSALNLEALPEPPDVADALAIALCCADDLSRFRPTTGALRSVR